MRTLSIDIETYSSIDLISAGVYRYTEAPDFEVLLFAYAWDDEPVQIVDLASGEKLPYEILQNLTCDTFPLGSHTIKAAFNGNFERTCLAKSTGQLMPSEQWDCTQARALSMGLPGHLDGVASVLGLDQQKDKSGKTLINYFSKPCAPTRTNHGRTRNLPRHDPDKWELFKSYCKQDVEVERAVRKALSDYRPPEWERRLWILDQQINDRGVLVDPVLVENAITIDQDQKEKLLAEAVALTCLDNPNSVSQLKTWLEQAEGEEIESLTKESIPALIAGSDSEITRRVLALRQEMAKTSVKKYTAIQKAVCTDGRVRGLIQYYGARTGRWTGRLVQVHNLPKNFLKDLGLARQLTRSGDREGLEFLFGNVPDTLSQLIRTAFIPEPGHTFAVADFSAIEARIIAWLAGERWRQDVFATHGKIYEASAATMFHIPLEAVTKTIRQKGKVAELALGYQGGPKALETMGALKMGLTPGELPGLVSAWRGANPNIVNLWAAMEEGALAAVATKQPTTVRKHITFELRGSVLFVKLPSGRELAYQRPQIEPGNYGRDQLAYYGQNQTTKKWQKETTYGGKWTENIVQAIARDCLAVSMLKLDKEGYKTVMHVHDEVVIEARADRLDEICEIMGRPVDWAPGLELRADGFTTEFYRKED